MRIPFFPNKRIAIKTSLTVSQAFHKLERAINPSERPDPFAIENPFSGKITPPTFLIYEQVPRRTNSFIPIINGTIRQEQGQTRISVNLKSGGCIIAFVLVWCYFFGLMLFLSLLSWIKGIRFDLLLLLVPLVGISVMLSMLHFGFKSGEKSAKAFLVKVFEGEII